MAKKKKKEYKPSMLLPEYLLCLSNEENKICIVGEKYSTKILPNRHVAKNFWEQALTLFNNEFKVISKREYLGIDAEAVLAENLNPNLEEFVKELNTKKKSDQEFVNRVEGSRANSKKFFATVGTKKKKDYSKPFDVKFPPLGNPIYTKPLKARPIKQKPKKKAWHVVAADELLPKLVDDTCERLNIEERGLHKCSTEMLVYNLFMGRVNGTYVFSFKTFCEIMDRLKGRDRAANNYTAAEVLRSELGEYAYNYIDTITREKIFAAMNNYAITQKN